MQFFVTGSLVGLALGALLGPRLLRRTRTLPLSQPSRGEVWITGLLFALSLLGIVHLPARLGISLAAASLLTGFGCVGLILLASPARARRWPFPIRMMHVLAGVLLLLHFARVVFPLLVPWLAMSHL